MKTEYNIPLNWELLFPIIDGFSNTNKMVFRYEVSENKISVKLLKPGYPIRLDIYQTKSGLTLNADLGRDKTANLELLNYIDEQIKFERLYEDRITFKNVSIENRQIIKSSIIEFCMANDLVITEGNTNILRLQVQDKLINNSVKIEVYSSGTVYLFGYTTPLFEEIYNLVFYQTEQLALVQNSLLNDLVLYAKKLIDNDNLEICFECSYEKSCLSDGTKMLNMAHFARTIATYPCQRVTNTYVCKYMHRYSSELINLLSANINNFKELDEINVLSLGCGACPDYLAFSYFFRSKKIIYTGIDYNRKWSHFHDFYKKPNSDQDELKYFYKDFFEIIDQLNRDDKPLNFNSIVMSYVVSSISVNHSILEIADLFGKINERILRFLPIGSLLIINDINNKEHFVDIMENVIKEKTFMNFDIQRYYHQGKNRRYLSSGHAITETKIRFHMDSDLVEKYNAQLECNSAAYIFRRTS